MITLADMTQHMSALEKYVVSLIYDEMEGGNFNLLKVCPIESIDSLYKTFRTREDEGPVTGVGSRALYGAYPEGTGSWKQRGFQAGNIGGRATVDQIILMDDPTIMKDEIRYKVQLLNRQLNNAFINGDRATNPNFVNGIKKFVTTNMTVPPTQFGGAYTNGISVGASTANQIAYLDLLEYLIGLVNHGGGEVRLIGNYEAQRQYSKAIRDTGRFGVNEAYYDRTSDNYKGIKWLNPGANTAVKDPVAGRANANAVIPNNLVYNASGATTTQVWAVRFSTATGVAMYQRRALKVTELGRLQASPQEVTEIDWWGGFFAKRDDAVAVLNGVIAA